MPRRLINANSEARLASADPVLPKAAFNGASSVLTLAETAQELRCSKAHVSNVVNGKVPNLPKLPVVRIGRRVLVRFEALQSWIRCAEQVEAAATERDRFTAV